MKKINAKRNLLEHEYENPTEKAVENALDVAELFIKYTDKYLNRALRECYLIDDDLHGTVTLDWDNCRIVFTYREYIDGNLMDI